MAVTSTEESRQTTEVVVSVRIPDGSDGDLTTEATRRLARADGVVGVTLDGVEALDPRLSATVVTVAATIERRGGQTDPTVTDALEAVVGVDVVET